MTNSNYSFTKNYSPISAPFVGFSDLHNTRKYVMGLRGFGGIVMSKSPSVSNVEYDIWSKDRYLTGTLKINYFVELLRAPSEFSLELIVDLQNKRQSQSIEVFLERMNKIFPKS